MTFCQTASPIKRVLPLHWAFVQGSFSYFTQSINSDFFWSAQLTFLCTKNHPSLMFILRYRQLIQSLCFNEIPCEFCMKTLTIVPYYRIVPVLDFSWWHHFMKYCICCILVLTLSWEIHSFETICRNAFWFERSMAGRRDATLCAARIEIGNWAHPTNHGKDCDPKTEEFLETFRSRGGGHVISNIKNLCCKFSFIF